MKRRTVLLLLGLTSLLAATAGAQTSNLAPPITKPHTELINVPLPVLQGGDLADNAYMIPGLPFFDTGTTDGYTNDYDENCPYSGSTSPDVVYLFAPNANLVVDVDLYGSFYDTKVYIYRDLIDPGYPYACNDDYYSDYVSFLPCVLFEAGHAYYIVIDGYDGAFGSYVLAMDECVPPPTPDCTNAIPENEPYYNVEDTVNTGCNAVSPALPVFGQMSCGHTYCGTTFTYVTPEGNGYRDTDWYQFTMPTAGTVTFNAVMNIGFNMFIIADGCPATILYQSTDNLNTGTLTATLDAGNYVFWIGLTVYTGVPDPVTYQVDFISDNCLPPLAATEQPAAFELQPNVPNPFNPSTTLNFTMDEVAQARLTVFDLSGQQVATLLDGRVERGPHSVVFNAGALPSGVYFYTLEALGQTETRKMVLLK